jgi:VWFA-related protein
MRTHFLLAATGGLLLAAGCAAQASDAAPTATTTLKVDANLVVVPVTVRDNKDRLIRSLNKEDFTLTADGKPQAIRYFDREDDVPLMLGLLVDVSGSQRSVLDSERDASSAFLDGMLQPGRDQAFVVQFGHAADLLADVTPSVPKLQAALQKVDGDSQRPSFDNGGSNNDGNGSNDPNNTSSNNNGGYGGNGGGRRGGSRGGGQSGYGGSGTVLYDAVFLSSDEVLKKAPAAKGTNAGQARKALVVLSDGVDRGSKESLPSAIEAAQRNNTALYAIYYKGEDSHNGGGGGGFPGGGGGGFPGRFPGGGGGGYPGGGGHGGGRGGGGGGNQQKVDGKKILERMADETGGRVYEVSKKMTLTEIYKQIAEELRSQYRLGFSPSNNEPGYHKLVIEAPKDKKAILQARDGYYTNEAK